MCTCLSKYNAEGYLYKGEKEFTVRIEDLQ